MSMQGVDYSQGYDIASLKNAGVQFACRYIGYTATSLPQNKIIVYKESYDLARSGLFIVSNWEWTADRASIRNAFYNGSPIAARTGGVADAQAAVSAHQSIGGPPAAPIYFSIDYDTDGTDCVDYFNGIVSVLGLSRVGAYGPPAALEFLLIKGLIKYTWAWSDPPAGMNLLPHIIQTATDVKMGRIIVDTDTALAADFGQWTMTGQLRPPLWFQYPVGVPPCNSNYDVGLGGSHDLTVLAPPNMEVENIVIGSISDISAPSWGKQVGIKLDMPIAGHPYFSYLHLSAVNPSLNLGEHVSLGEVIGWVGGATDPSQYAGTSNPTGQNFCDSPDMSSQVQVGIALHDGPAYGGVGWVNFPPIMASLDPSHILAAARNAAFLPVVNFKLQQFNAVWLSSSIGVKWFGSGLYKARLTAFLDGHLGACTPVQDEQTVSIDGSEVICNWDGNPIKWQRYDDGSHGEWLNGVGHIYDSNGRGV